MSQNSYKVTELRQIGNAVQWMVGAVQAGLLAGEVNITLAPESRSAIQNRRLWAVLTDIATQVDWYGQKLSQEDWKHVFTASMTKQRVVPGIDGGFVVCGLSTSKMTKQQFADLLTIIDAFGSEQGVKWSDPALETFSEYREAQA
jgi:hypothetical protein